MNDGQWHSIKVNRVRQNLDIEIDGEIYNSRVTGSYYELNTDNNVLLGKGTFMNDVTQLGVGGNNNSDAKQGNLYTWEGAQLFVQWLIRFLIFCFEKQNFFLFFQQLSLQLIDNCTSSSAASIEII